MNPDMLDLSALARMYDFDAYSASLANAQHTGRLVFPTFISWPQLFRQ